MMEVFKPLGAAMKKQVHWTLLALAANAAAASIVWAADGLVAPAADSWWPGWQARIALQTAELTTLSTARYTPTQSPAQAPARGLFGGAVLGDYTFAQPSFGSFRATSGLVVGSLGGAPQQLPSAQSPLGLAVFSRPAASGFVAGSPADAPQTVPYLGLGFSRQALHDGLSIVADLGVVAQSSSSLGRAVFGNSGVENALREVRLSPMWQLGVRYAF